MEDEALAVDWAVAPAEGASLVDALGDGAGDGPMPLSQRLAFVLLLCSLVAIIAVIVAWTTELGVLREWLPLVGFFVVVAVVAAVMLWREMVRTRRVEALRARVRALEDQKDVAAAYHESIAKDEERILATRREVAKEMRQALSMVRDCDEGGAFGSLDRALELMGDAAYRQCDHRTVDVIAVIKRRACEEAGVEPRFALEVPRDIPISAVDLCAVVGNLADNGVAGALRFRDEQMEAVRGAGAEGSAVLQGAEAGSGACDVRPFLELRSVIDGGYLVVTAKSPLAAADEASFGARHSGLRRRQATLDDVHGWGLSIVESIAKRHDGWFSVETAGGLFSVRAVLKLGEANG